MHLNHLAKSSRTLCLVFTIVQGFILETTLNVCSNKQYFFMKWSYCDFARSKVLSAACFNMNVEPTFL